ncbi:MAG: hypothetical protein QOG72_2463 [Sphingomonadales bacterium]|jgi:hypothetical protein|nr:hypothetical protein [Sphingomonadales bacterium]
MAGPVTFRPMCAGDVVQLALQPSQHVCLGVTRAVHSIEEGEELVAGGPAWTAVGGDGRILCCAGFTLLWPANGLTGGHAVAWALLAADLGAAQLAITRFARRRIEESRFDRIEAIVRAGIVAEPKWARLVGLRRRALLRKWGPEGKTHLLFERVG